MRLQDILAITQAHSLTAGPDLEHQVRSGFAPLGLNSPALELFRQTSPDDARAQWPQLTIWPLIRGGDAHRLSEICPALRLTLAQCTLAELALAFSQQHGRSFSVLP